MAEHLEEEELVERIRLWWRENGASLVGSVLLVVGGWAGWNWYDTSVEQEAAESSETFFRYVELREAGDDDSEEASELLAVLDAEFQGSAPQLLSLMYRAGDAVAGEDMPTAASYLEQVVQASPGDPLESIARLRLVRVYIEQNRLEEAEALLHSADGEGFLSLRNELRGDIQSELGDWDGARASYEQAIAAEQSTGGVDSWPFLPMKLYGLMFEDETPAILEVDLEEETSQAGEGVADVEEAEDASS